MGGSERVVMEYSHKELCDMLITLGICSSRAGTAAPEHPLRHPDEHYPDVMCFDDWGSVPMRNEM